MGKSLLTLYVFLAFAVPLWGAPGDGEEDAQTDLHLEAESKTSGGESSEFDFFLLDDELKPTSGDVFETDRPVEAKPHPSYMMPAENPDSSPQLVESQYGQLVGKRFAERIKDTRTKRKNLGARRDIFFSVLQEVADISQQMPLGPARDLYEQTLIYGLEQLEKEIGPDKRAIWSFTGSEVMGFYNRLAKMGVENGAVRNAILKRATDEIRHGGALQRTTLALDTVYEISQDKLHNAQVALQNWKGQWGKLALYLFSIEKSQPQKYNTLVQALETVLKSGPQTRFRPNSPFSSPGYQTLLYLLPAQAGEEESLGERSEKTWSESEKKNRGASWKSRVHDWYRLRENPHPALVVRFLQKALHHARKENKPDRFEYYLRDLHELKIPSSAVELEVMGSAKTWLGEDEALNELAKSNKGLSGVGHRLMGGQNCPRLFRKLVEYKKEKSKFPTTLVAASAVATGVGVGAWQLSHHDPAAFENPQAQMREREEEPPLLQPPLEEMSSDEKVDPVQERVEEPKPTHEFSQQLLQTWQKYLKQIEFSGLPKAEKELLKALLNDGVQPGNRLPQEGSTPILGDRITQTWWEKFRTQYINPQGQGVSRVALENRLVELAMEWGKSQIQKAIEEGDFSVDPFELKLATENKLKKDSGPLVYNLEATNPLQWIFEGRSQCASGSRCHSLVARSLMDPKTLNSFHPVFIMEEGHLLVGYINGQEELIGLETTVGGRGRKNYKKISQIDEWGKALRIVEAQDFILSDLFAAYLPPARQIELREEILSKSAKNLNVNLSSLEHQVQKVAPLSQTSTLTPDGPLNASLFSFGTPPPSHGDKPRDDRDELDPEKEGPPSPRHREKEEKEDSKNADSPQSQPPQEVQSEPLIPPYDSLALTKSMEKLRGMDFTKLRTSPRVNEKGEVEPEGWSQSKLMLQLGEAEGAKLYRTFQIYQQMKESQLPFNEDSRSRQEIDSSEWWEILGLEIGSRSASQESRALALQSWMHEYTNKMLIPFSSRLEGTQMEYGLYRVHKKFPQLFKQSYATLVPSQQEVIDKFLSSPDLESQENVIELEQGYR